MITALQNAEPDHKLEVYRNLGLHLTYTPEHERCGQKWILPRTGGIRFASENRHLPDAYAIPLAGPHTRPPTSRSTCHSYP